MDETREQSNTIELTDSSSSIETIVSGVSSTIESTLGSIFGKYDKTTQTVISISTIQTHATSEQPKKISTWKIQYEKARKYLSEQIKDAEVEEELLKATFKLIEEKTTKEISDTNEDHNWYLE